MLYGSFSKGFKSGSWTTRVAAPVPPDPTKPADKQAPSFNPEKADTFEIGFKSQLFDRMLQVNAAAFYTDYKGIQIQIQRGIGASRSEEHTSERQSLIRIPYAVLCLKKK